MIGKFMDWMLSPLTRRVRREVEAAIKEQALRDASVYLSTR